MDVSWHGGTEGNFDISLISILLHNPPHCIICSNFFSGIFCSFCCSPFCSTPFFVMYISLFVMYIFLLFCALVVSSYLFVCCKFFPFQSPFTTESTELKRPFSTPPASCFPLLLQGYYGIPPCIP